MSHPKNAGVSICLKGLVFLKIIATVCALHVSNFLQKIFTSKTGSPFLHQSFYSRAATVATAAAVTARIKKMSLTLFSGYSAIRKLSQRFSKNEIQHSRIVRLNYPLAPAFSEGQADESKMPALDNRGDPSGLHANRCGIRNC